MRGRFGNVIYWAACGVAALVVAYGFGALIFDQSMSTQVGWRGLAVAGAAAAVIWLAGRAARYVLVGK